MTDSFIQSMTFSRPKDYLFAYDCDNCDDIPPSIREFLNDRKRERMATGLVKRTQQRSLVSQRGQISLHSLFMPKYAEPVIEFGSSHRIVWIKRLVKRSMNQNNDTTESVDSEGPIHNGDSILQWIGKGIIGSSDEEKGRVSLNDWTGGSVLFVPSNGGKAVGWIHTTGTTEINAETPSDGNVDSSSSTNETEEVEIKKATETLESDNLAILYMASIPVDMLIKKREKSEETNQNWADTLITCCREGVERCKKESNIPSYYKFPAETALLLKEAMRELENTEVQSDRSEPAPKRVRQSNPDA